MVFPAAGSGDAEGWSDVRDVGRVLILANPIAGRGRGRGIARRLGARLRAEGYDVRTSFKRPELATLPDSMADVRAVIVIGGDGTLRAVAHQFVGRCAETHRDDANRVTNPAQGSGAASSPPAGERSTPSASGGIHSGDNFPCPPLLVVPLGTANLMGRHLGIRWSDGALEDQVAAAVAGRRVVRLDAGRINGELFLLMVGVGFDAAVVHQLAKVRRGPIGYAHYLLPAALALKEYAYPTLRVTVDGHEVWRPSPAVAFVGNVAEYGTGFPMLPKARPDDGLLDVCVMPCRSPADLVRLFLLAASGDHLSEEGVIYLTGSRVRIETPGADGPVPVQVDGDAAGHTPIDIDLFPVRLPFIVP